MISINAHLRQLREDKDGRLWNFRSDIKPVVILFTPRSGSTWFGDLLQSTGLLGFPQEFMNYECMKDANSDLIADSEYSFLCGCLASRITPNLVFSIEVTWGDIARLETVDFFDFFSEAKFIWLRRQDITRQAISLQRAIDSGIFHSRSLSSALDVNEQSLTNYRKEIKNLHSKIINWIGHIINYENSTEVQLALRGIDPLRLMYEDVQADPQRAVANVLRFCGIESEPSGITSSFIKIRDEGSMELYLDLIQEERVSINKLLRLRPALSR